MSFTFQVQREDIMSDITEITQLILRERQGRDRGWWAQMEECYHSESVVSISWLRSSGADFVARSKEIHSRGIRPVHRLSPPVVHINRDRAVVEVPTSISLRTLIHGVDADLESSVRNLYQVERHDSNWKIMFLTCIYERDMLTSAMPGTSLDLDIEQLARFRKSYRCLAYHLSLEGHSVPDSLFGDDIPEPVDALYASAFDWMRT